MRQKKAKSPKRALVPLAVGFEEMEAVSVIDILRRAGVHVDVAGVGADTIEGSHGILIMVDLPIEEAETGAYDLIVLPGGMPGTHRLGNDPKVLEMVSDQHSSGRWLGAICAAPVVLEKCGILAGRRVTSHFSVADQLPSGTYAGDRVVVDGHLVTSRGAGTAIEFALKLVSLIQGEEEAHEISEGILNGMPF